MSQTRKKGEERDMNKSIVSVHGNGDDHHHFLLTIIIFLFMSMKRHLGKGIERMGVGEKRGKCRLFQPGCNTNNFFHGTHFLVTHSIFSWLSLQYHHVSIVTLVHAY